MKSDSGRPVSAVVMYREDALAVLRRKVAMSSSQDVIFSLQDFPEETRHSFRMNHGQKSQVKVRERVMALRISDV